MRNHDWCKSPSRDEAVRAAEEGRSGPLPTLEEAIATITNKGDDMGTTSEIQSAETRFDAAERITKALTADRFAAAIIEVDKLRARVAELEGEAKGLRRDAAATKNRMWVLETGNSAAHNLITSLESQLESVACRAATAETALESAPAASGAAGTEPVAWGVRLKQSMEVPPGCASPRRVGRKTFTQFYSTQEEAAQRSGGTVVPLYAAPQAAKGWLTPEEQEAIMFLIGNRSQFAPQTPHEERRNVACQVCHALVARSSPPEVVLPKKNWSDGYWEQARKDERDAEWLAALAAAGVTVKEVGRDLS